MGQINGMGRAAHIFFHVAHKLAWLDVQPACVKRNAFTDQRNFGVRFASPV